MTEIARTLCYLTQIYVDLIYSHTDQCKFTKNTENVWPCYYPNHKNDPIPFVHWRWFWVPMSRAENTFHSCPNVPLPHIYYIIYINHWASVPYHFKGFTDLGLMKRFADICQCAPISEPPVLAPSFDPPPPSVVYQCLDSITWTGGRETGTAVGKTGLISDATKWPLEKIV